MVIPCKFPTRYIPVTHSSRNPCSCSLRDARDFYSYKLSQVNCDICLHLNKEEIERENNGNAGR